MAAQDTIKALRARVRDLEGEVVRLKRELAGRAPATVEAAPRGIGRIEGHGQFCTGFCCRGQA
jgi:hypothetical protein